MAHENWQQVKEIFADALRQTPELRPEFLDSACRDNKNLRREVESLLTSFDSAESFMETPAVGEMPDVPETGAHQLEIGKCFGHYEIIELLGIGGMGEVYLAEDKKLDRQVAVKFLNEKFASHESNLQRFMREAKAASSLNHPNILVIHEIGEAEETHFIVSEFVRGKTLREISREKRLELPEILGISIQIAKALAAAHEARLVHRDIKPENIMIRPDGLVKILDFGLAKLVVPKSVGFSTVKPHDTARGVIMGTVNYMSPEQAKGGKIDERTDIFSFGAVLYEMLAGQTPFADDSMPEIYANLINQDPKPLAPDVPDELQRIVSKMLCKNKDERYQTMNELLADLQSLRGNAAFEAISLKDKNATDVLQLTTDGLNKRTAETNYSFTQQIKQPFVASSLVALLIGAIGLYWFLSVKKTGADVDVGKSIESIAILPFENATEDTNLEYLSDGITENIINTLSSFPNLRVLPRNTVFNYKGKTGDAYAIGQELKVPTVLTGKIVQRGDHLLIQTELIDIDKKAQIWGQQYVYDSTDIFASQNFIAKEVVSNLRLKLSDPQKQKLAKSLTENPEAQKAYLNGLYFLNQSSQQSQNVQISFAERKPFCEKSVEQFQQAIRLEPNYAQAYADLARAYRCLANNQFSEYHQKTKEAAQNAIRLDETTATAHRILAWTLWQQDWNWTEAESEFRRAIELNPNESGEARRGLANLLSAQGRHTEAIEQIESIEQNFPNAVIDDAWVGFIYKDARRYDRAIEKFQSIKKLRPENTWSRYGLSEVYALKEMYPEAIAEAKEIVEITKNLSHAKMFLGAIYARAGEIDKAKKILNEYKEQPDRNPLLIGSTYLKLGDKEQAFFWLNKACSERSLNLMRGIKVSPAFDKLRDDPRYDDLLRCVGLK